MDPLPADITIGTTLEASRMAVPLHKVGRTNTEKHRFCEANLGLTEEEFWAAQTDYIYEHALSIIKWHKQLTTLPHPINFPCLTALDPDIGVLVLSKEKTPLPDLSIGDIPQSVREARMDTLSAESLLVLAQVRHVLSLLEIAIVRRDHTGAESATRGLAMRIAGIALLTLAGRKAREEFCEEFYLNTDWHKLVKTLTSKVSVPQEDPKVGPPT